MQKDFSQNPPIDSTKLNLISLIITLWVSFNVDKYRSSSSFQPFHLSFKVDCEWFYSDSSHSNQGFLMITIHFDWAFYWLHSFCPIMFSIQNFHNLMPNDCLTSCLSSDMFITTSRLSSLSCESKLSLLFHSFILNCFVYQMLH